MGTSVGACDLSAPPETPEPSRRAPRLERLQEAATAGSLPTRASHECPSATTSGADGETGTDDGPIGQICGDGFITGTEQCDCGGTPCTPAGLGGAMCVGLVNPSMPERVYTGGLLDCNPASCQYRFDTCTFCGDRIVNGIEQCELGEPTDVTCMDLGMGDGVDELPCAAD